MERVCEAGLKAAVMLWVVGMLRSALAAAWMAGFVAEVATAVRPSALHREVDRACGDRDDLRRARCKGDLSRAQARHERGRASQSELERIGHRARVGHGRLEAAAGTPDGGLSVTCTPPAVTIKVPVVVPLVAESVVEVAVTVKG